MGSVKCTDRRPKTIFNQLTMIHLTIDNARECQRQRTNSGRAFHLSHSIQSFQMFAVFAVFPMFAMFPMFPAFPRTRDARKKTEHKEMRNVVSETRASARAFHSMRSLEFSKAETQNAEAFHTFHAFHRFQVFHVIHSFHPFQEHMAHLENETVRRHRRWANLGSKLPKHGGLWQNSRMAGFPVSENVARMQASSTLKAAQAAAELRKGVDVIDLTVGEPDFDTPQFIKDYAIEALGKGMTKYTASAGLASFREAVAGFYARRFGASINPAEIAPHAAASEPSLTPRPASSTRATNC